MSAKGLFVTGFTAEEVKAIQSRAKALLMEGKTIMSWSDNGTSTNKQFVMPVREVLEECAYALRKLDPETYGRPSRRVSLSYLPGRLPM